MSNQFQICDEVRTVKGPVRRGFLVGMFPNGRHRGELAVVIETKTRRHFSVDVSDLKIVKQCVTAE